MTKHKTILSLILVSGLFLISGCDNSSNLGTQVAEKINAIEKNTENFTGESYIALRSSGVKQTDMWNSDKNWSKSLKESIKTTDKQLKSENQVYDLIEICLPIKE